MTSNSHKSKQYLLVALKVLILGATFYYIYHKFSENTSTEVKNFIANIGNATKNSWLYIAGFILMACINWFLEITKWKTIVQSINVISFGEALKQSLYAHTVSLATPNRIGDYGAKAFFYPKEKRKRVLLCNFFSNSAQMTVTTFLGVIGLLIVIATYNLQISKLNVVLIVVVALLLFFVGYLLKEKQLLIQGLSIKNVVRHFYELSKVVKLKLFGLSFLRYAVFSTLFYVLLVFFGADIAISTAFPIIFSMYFLVSVIPTVFIFDVVIRGGIAIWLFSLTGIDEITVMATVFSMWLLNFVLPAIFGAYYLFSYSPNRK